jgi:hypothetical protein
MPRMEQYDYIFAIGTFFALLDAFNNGASEWSWLVRLVHIERAARCPRAVGLACHLVQPKESKVAHDVWHS